MTYIPFSQRAIQLIDLWALTPKEQIRLFQIKILNREKLRAWLKRTPNHRCGKLGILIEIQNCIDTFVPKARRKDYFRASNDYFGGKSPFELIMEHGDQAYEQVLGYVEYRCMIFKGRSKLSSNGGRL